MTMELSAVPEKDLGVYFTSDLKPSTPCIKAAAKARKIIGMVRRNFKRLDKEDFFVIYKTALGILHTALVTTSDQRHKVFRASPKSATNLILALWKYSYTD